MCPDSLDVQNLDERGGNLLSCHAEQNGSLLAGHRELAACFRCQITDHGAAADETLTSLYTRPTSNASSGRSTLQVNAQAGTEKLNFC